MKKKLLEFLKALEVAVPPPSGHHAITFCQYGSDETGWEDRLGLHVRIGNGARTVFIEDKDLELSVEDFVLAVQRCVAVQEAVR